MLKPQQKIFLMWSTAFLTGLVLATSALGVYNNFDRLNTWASAGFFLLAILAFWLGYKKAGVVGVILGLLYNPEMSVSLPRHIWVIFDIISIYAIIHFTYWATNPYKKGMRFEKYVASLFPEPDFVIQNQSRDTSKSFGRKIESDSDPDLILRNKKSGKIFAVECKWRGRWWKDKEGHPGLYWNQYKGTSYTKFGEDNDMPVFIALGIGGSPEKPKEVYFLEASKMNYLFLTQALIRSGYSISQMKELLK